MINNDNEIVHATTEQLPEALRQQRCADHDEPGAEQCHLCVDLTTAADRIDELEADLDEWRSLGTFEQVKKGKEDGHKERDALRREMAEVKLQLPPNRVGEARWKARAIWLYERSDNIDLNFTGIDLEIKRAAWVDARDGEG